MEVKSIHILGICGTLMSGLALLARESGFAVTGSDENAYPPMSDFLSEQNIKVIQSYKKKDLPKADLYIIGNVLSRGNEAVEHILDLKLPYTSAPAWMAENILIKRRVIAVSGTHGKTSTTAMIAWILETMGVNAGYLIAGMPKDFSVSARLGKDDLFVIEADEYDTSFFDKRPKFMHYNPEVLIINNLEFDHVDIYSNLEEIQKQFHNLIRIMPSDGCLIFPNDDINIKEVLELGTWSQIQKFGVDKEQSNYYEAITEDFLSMNIKLGDASEQMNWNLSGEYNCRNAMAALLAVCHFGFPLSSAVKGLKSFSGVSRRLDLVIDREEIKLFDDFAHHPTAIRETLKGLRSRYKENRIIALIELRSNTMKSGFHDENLLEATIEADEVHWKGEKREQIDALVNQFPSVHSSIDSVPALVEKLKISTQINDVIVIMSNGNFDGIADLLVSKFQKI